MIAETYTCILSNNTVEYGYTFKQKEGADDSEFDIVLGTANSQKDLIGEFIDGEFERFKFTADIIAKVLSREYAQAIDILKARASQSEAEGD